LNRFLVPGTDPMSPPRTRPLSSAPETRCSGSRTRSCSSTSRRPGSIPAATRLIEIAASRCAVPRSSTPSRRSSTPGARPARDRAAHRHRPMPRSPGRPPPSGRLLGSRSSSTGRDVVAHNAPFDRASSSASRAGARPARGSTRCSSRSSRSRALEPPPRRPAEAFGGARALAPRRRRRRGARTVWRARSAAWTTSARRFSAGLRRSRRGRLAGAQRARAPRGGIEGERFRPRRGPQVRVGTERATALPDAEEVECSCPDRRGDRSRVLGGRHRGPHVPRLRARDEQAEMARAVTDAFAGGRRTRRRGGHRCGQVARVPRARGCASRCATTWAWGRDQDQRAHGPARLRRAPALCKVLGEPLRFVSLKGYEHYLCLRKLDRFAASLARAPGEVTVGIVAALLAWVAQSRGATRRAINVHLRARSAPRSPPRSPTARASGAASTRTSATCTACAARLLGARGGDQPRAALPRRRRRRRDPAAHPALDRRRGARGGVEARKQLSMECSRLELSVVLGGLGTGRGRARWRSRRAHAHLGHDEEPALISPPSAEMERRCPRRRDARRLALRVRARCRSAPPARTATTRATCG
jgi:hypothetical protein